jgi:hypothetical protein
MDGMLPPVDAGSWFDFQRRRAEQAARQRIAAAGATAGDWIGRATSTLDGLVPDRTPPPPARPPEPPPLPAPSPLEGVGDWAQGALARIGQIGSDAGDTLGGALGGIGARLPELAKPETYARAAEHVPLPPALEGARAGLRGYTQDVGEAVRTLATDPEAVRAGASTVQRLTPGGLIGTGAELATGQTTLPELGGEVARGLPALGAVASLAPTPSAIAGNVIGNVAEEGALSAGLPSQVAGGIGLAADVLTPDPGTAGRVARKAPGLLEGAVDALGGIPYRFGQAARREYGDTFGVALRSEPEQRLLSIWVPGRGLIEGTPADRMHTDIARRVFQETGTTLPPTSVRVDVRPGSPDGTRPPQVALSPFDQTPSVTQERAALRAAVADIAKDTPPDWRLSVMLNDMSEYQGVVGDGTAGLQRTGHYSARNDYGDDVFGIRRGQRAGMPRLTPEQQAQRAADGEAEQRVFDAISRLWRQGPEGEAAADDLRFLAVGKGAEGERVAREYLAAKGLEDVLPAGVVPAGAAAGDDLLGLARRATEPFLARGAQTTGERAFDLAAGTAGGVAGAATADEDATWQERAGRFALGSAAGALGGANLRQLGRVASGTLGDDVLGAAAGRGRPAPKAPGGGLVLRDIPELMGALPLAAPTSLAANLTGGAARTLERLLGKVFEGRPVEAGADLVALLREVPGATRGLKRAYRGGPTAENPGMTGEAVDQGLTTRGGLAGALSAGTKANSATDAFWRQLNEAGAGAAARRRGLGAVDTARLRQSAGDFATFSGPNSKVAQSLTKLKRTIHDPDADFGDKAAAWAVTSMAPYVMMPERLLRATVGALVPVESAVGAVRAFQKGDRAAARELGGRALAGVAATSLLTKMYLDGAITGDAPADANERRRREAQGEQWNTLQLPGGARISSRFLGSVGMQANAIATTLDAAKQAQAKGADPGAVLEAGVNGAAKWFLDASYLSDLQDFGEQVGKGNLTGGLRSVAAGLPSRFTSPVTGALNALDPYEREADEFPEMVASRTGLRALVPTRIDPTTGEDQRRAGSGLSRYVGERGSVASDEAVELARLGLQPRVLGRTEEYEGAKQTPAQRRAAQRAVGSETGKAVRDAMAKPGYAALDDAGKKSALQAALRAAADRADVVLGESVTRGTKQQAQREWDAVPKYVGVQGTPDEVRTQNAAISRAQSLETEYRKKHGDAGWRAKLREDDPEAFALVNKTRRDADVLARQRKAIEKKYGVTLG